MNAPSPPLPQPTPAVPPGGTLRIIAPAGVVDPERTRQGARILRQLGFKVQLPDALIGRADPHLPYLSGDDRVRARELEMAFTDRAVHGIVCARGGYGAMRLLDHLDPDLIRAHPKPLVGFSDITALHGFLAARAGMATWHGPMLQSLPLLQEQGPSTPQHPIDALNTALTGQWR
ncbi:MAG: LD-carboxypeptidase, partial [Myxococcota bacterium]